MKPSLTELYSIEEAGPGDDEILGSVPLDLQISTFSRYPWKNDRDSGQLGEPNVYVLGHWSKDIRNVTCSLSVLTRTQHAGLTNRGTALEGFMVDLEIFVMGDTEEEWILHVERPFEDQESAMAYAEKLMKFVDKSKAGDLLKVPRSGKLSMSKLTL